MNGKDGDDDPPKQTRKLKLVWNDRTGEMEFDHSAEKRRKRWRWPYRLRPDLPYWVREWVRAGVFFAALALLYMAWSYFRASP